MRRALLLASLLAAAPAAHGEGAFRPSTILPGNVPGGFTYQGRLQINGSYPTSDPRAPWGVVFRIWDSSTAVAADHLLATIPSTYTSTTIDLVGGLFKADIPVSPEIVVGGGTRWLEVEILKPSQKPGAGETMKPRGQLLSMPYALVAKAVEGTIEISSGGLSVTTAAATGNTAFYISSTTAFIGIWTDSPYSLLTMSSGSLTIDGTGASLRLSSGAAAVDGAGASLVVLGPAWFGDPGTRSSFDAGGLLSLASPLGPASGGLGWDFSGAVRGDIPYFSLAGARMSPLGIGPASSVLRSNAGIPAWTGAAYPVNAAKGDLLYASAADWVSRLTVAASSRILTTDGTLPVWSAATYPPSVGQGDLLYGYAADSVSLLGVGASDRLLQSDGTVPGWTKAVYPGSAAQGDLLYGSALDTVSRLTWTVRPRAVWPTPALPTARAGTRWTWSTASPAAYCPRPTAARART